MEWHIALPHEGVFETPHKSRPPTLEAPKDLLPVPYSARSGFRHTSIALYGQRGWELDCKGGGIEKYKLHLIQGTTGNGLNNSVITT